MTTIEYVTKRLQFIWLDNIGSVDSLVPAGIKSLPAKMLNNAMTPYGVTRPHWVKANTTAEQVISLWHIWLCYISFM